MTTTAMDIGQKELPAGWQWVKLGDVTEFLDSMRKPVNETERQKRVIGKEGYELYPYYGANGQVGLIDDYIFDFPAILLAEDGGHFGSSRRPIAYKVDGKYWVNNHAHILRPKDGVDFDYLYRSIMLRPDIALLTAGSTRAKLNQAAAKSINLPLPPLEEQKRIAAILNEQMDVVEKAREAAEERLEAAKALPAAYLRDVFPDSEDEVPAGWKWVKLGDVCEIARGGSPRPIDAYLTDSEDGVNWVKISDATASDKYIYETKEKIIEDGVSRSRLVHRGDFLLSNSMSFGRPYIMGTTGCIHDGWLVLRQYESAFDQDFLYHLLGSSHIYSQFEKLSSGSTVKNLNIQIVSGVHVAAPPLEDQQRIAAILNEQNAAASLAEESIQQELDTIEAMPGSLLRKAFSGEL